jgi:hypothetical protein
MSHVSDVGHESCELKRIIIRHHHQTFVTLTCNVKTLGVVEKANLVP